MSIKPVNRCRAQIFFLLASCTNIVYVFIKCEIFINTDAQCSNGLRNLMGCFTNVSRALQNILSKFVYCRNRTSYENFKLKLCTRAQSHGFWHAYKFSAWNSQYKCDFRYHMFSRDYFGELVKRWWNNPLILNWHPEFDGLFVNSLLYSCLNQISTFSHVIHECFGIS